METAAVPAERKWLAPLADLALVVAFPATVVLAFWAGQSVAEWLRLLVAAAGITAVVLLGRRALGTKRAIFMAIATWLTLYATSVASFIGAFSTCRRDLSAPWLPPTAMGVVYVGVGLFALRKRRWWGLPLAILLAFGVAFALYFALSLPDTGCGTGFE